MSDITLKPVNISKNDKYSEYKISLIHDHDPKIQLKKVTKPLSRFLNEEIRNKHGITVNITLKINFTKPGGDDSQTAYFKSKAQAITHENETIETLKNIGNELLNKIAGWISQGSGWVIEKVKDHRITIIKYKPLRGSSYLPLPEAIKIGRD